MHEGLDEFLEGLKMCLDKLYTFGVKQVPTKDEVVVGQGCLECIQDPSRKTLQ